MKHKLLLITSALQVSAQNKVLYLSDPITVRLSDNDFHVVEINALQVSPKRELSVMFYVGIDRPEERWMLVSEDDINADKMIEAIYERVMKMFKDQAKGVAA